jgi:hypothetical protein
VAQVILYLFCHYISMILLRDYCCFNFSLVNLGYCKLIYNHLPYDTNRPMWENDTESGKINSLVGFEKIIYGIRNRLKKNGASNCQY